MGTAREIETDELEARIEALPGFAAVRDAAARGGARRLPGRRRGPRCAARRRPRRPRRRRRRRPPRALLEALGGEARSHDRFGTATVRADAGSIDVARARAETYRASRGAAGGATGRASTTTSPAATSPINAMAVPVAEPGRLIDPHGGLADLARGAAARPPPQSFADDPTRALRAARYAARLGLAVEAETLAALRARRPLDRLRRPPRGGAAPARRRAPAAARVRAARRVGPARARATARRADRRGLAAAGGRAVERGRAPADAILAAVERRPRPRPASWPRPARDGPPRSSPPPAGASGVELALARALGAEWLDRYVGELRDVRPAITGDDLLAAGVPQGPGGRPRARGGAAGEARRRGDDVASASSRSRSRRRAPRRVSGMEWQERDGVRWLEARCPARPRPSRPGSAARASRPTTASTSGC